MSTTPSLESILTETTPQLSESESSQLFAQVLLTASATPIESPYHFSYFVFKPVSYMALFLIFLLGAGGTVAASGAAKPGDLLFPLDRATEAIHLALISGDEKVALQNQFINERFAELQTILNEENVTITTASSTDEALVAAPHVLLAASSSLRFTAKVFTETTVVQVTVGSSTPVYFTTAATTTAAIVDVLAARYDLPTTFVMMYLVIADQHRISTPSDKGVIMVHAGGEVRVANAVAVLAAQLAEQTDSKKRQAYLRTLLDEVSSVRVLGRDDAPLRLDTERVKIEDDHTDDRGEGSRVQIKQKGDQVEIKVEHNVTNQNKSNDTDESHEVPAHGTATVNGHSTSHDSDDDDGDGDEIDSDDDDSDGAVSFRNLGASVVAPVLFPGRRNGQSNDDHENGGSSGDHHGDSEFKSDKNHDE